MITSMLQTRSSRLRAALLLAALPALAAGQDVVQVAGDSHRVLLDNAQVRVLAVTLKPGQKAPMHSHPASVAYYLSDGKLRITLSDGKVVEREPKAGTAAYGEAVTHMVENVGANEFTQVQIELKAPAPAK